MADALGTPDAPTVGKTDKEITSATYGGAASLREDEPSMAPPSDMPTPEDAPAAAPDHFDAAFQKEIMDIVAGDGTAQDKSGKIVSLLKLQDKVGAVRGGGDSDPAPVGGDLEETEPEVDPKDDEPKKVAEAAPCSDGKKPMAESAPKAVSVVPNKAKLMAELLESIVIPCVDLLNGASVPVRGATLSAMCRTPSNRRKALVESFADPAPRSVRTAPRSQAGAVGLQETSPAAAARPSNAPPAAPKGKPLVERTPDELLDYAMGRTA